MITNIVITDSVIIIVIIFGPKNLVRQKHEDIVEKEKVHAMSD
jgi:hypothetical protein